MNIASANRDRLNIKDAATGDMKDKLTRRCQTLEHAREPDLDQAWDGVSLPYATHGGDCRKQRY